MQAKGMMEKMISVCGVLLPPSIIDALQDPTVRDARERPGVFISFAHVWIFN